MRAHLFLKFCINQIFAQNFKNYVQFLFSRKLKLHVQNIDEYDGNLVDETRGPVTVRGQTFPRSLPYTQGFLGDDAVDWGSSGPLLIFVAFCVEQRCRGGILESVTVAPPTRRPAGPRALFVILVIRDSIYSTSG